MTFTGWKLSGSRTRVKGEDGRVICDLATFRFTPEETEANGRLIEQAPDLFKALQALTLVTRDVSYTHAELVKAREVMAKV